MFLTDAEKTQLQQHIKDVEATTDAEIVTVIARSSDTYAFIPALWAALLSLCLPGLYSLLLESGFNGWLPAEDILRGMHSIYVAQVLVFLVLLMLFQWQPLQMWLIPASVKRRRAHRHAQLQFIRQRVHWTDSRAGILLFVSIAEHYVEIIADKAIAEKVDNQVWTRAIEHFTDKVREGQVAEGFTMAINTCHEVLLQHFPGGDKDRDELPDHLIEV